MDAPNLQEFREELNVQSLKNACCIPVFYSSLMHAFPEGKIATTDTVINWIYNIPGFIAQWPIPNQLIQILTEYSLVDIAQRLVDWIYFIQSILSVSEFHICWVQWQSNGEVDIPRSVEEMLVSNFLTSQQKFVIAANCCHENCMNEFQDNITEELRNMDYNNDPLVYYWVTRQLNELNRMPNRNNHVEMEILHRIKCTRPSAIKFLLNILPMNRRITAAEECIANCRTDCKARFCETTLICIRSCVSGITQRRIAFNQNAISLVIEKSKSARLLDWIINVSTINQPNFSVDRLVLKNIGRIIGNEPIARYLTGKLFQLGGSFAERVGNLSYDKLDFFILLPFSEFAGSSIQMCCIASWEFFVTMFYALPSTSRLQIINHIGVSICLKSNFNPIITRIIDDELITAAQNNEFARNAITSVLLRRYAQLNIDNIRVQWYVMWLTRLFFNPSPTT